jgi:hypothetical protein
MSARPISALATAGTCFWQPKRISAPPLLKPDGWLTLIGLQFLDPGENRIEAEGLNLGTAVLAADNQVRVTRALAAPATINILVIDHGGQKALRIRDSAAATRRNFSGWDYFPIDPSWRIEARWVPYPGPHSVSITNVLGQVSREAAPKIRPALSPTSRPAPCRPKETGYRWRSPQAKKIPRRQRLESEALCLCVRAEPGGPLARVPVPSPFRTLHQ